MGNNSSSDTCKNKRLNNQKGQASRASTNNPKSSIVEDDLNTDDELYVMSDDDEMCAEIDDELYNTNVTEGIEDECDSNKELFDYESNSDVPTENDSDSEFKNDLVGSCLNGDEFTIPEREKFRLLQGMMFRDVYAFREVLYEYSIQWGFTLIKYKNEKHRVTAHCGSEGCDWRVHASFMPDGVTFKIKTCNTDHTCVMNQKLKASAKWMAQKIVGLLRSDSNAKPQILRDELAKYGVHPTEMQLFRAKQKAIKLIDGNHANSYTLLPKYCMMIVRTNPGSIAKIEFEMSIGSVVPSVKRMFVGLDALKKGFLFGCQPFIGFDGCHLKGPYGGVLLAAIGLDGNKGLFPIAYAIVESENKDSWLFFFEWLSQMLDDFPRDRLWTFMSDRQKGLIEAVNKKVPYAMHRKCCMLILSNFRTKFSGLLLRKLFWVTSRSYTAQGFKEAMEKIRELKPDAFEWLQNILVQLWPRHTFSVDLKNDHFTINISESFNNWVGNLRGKPVLTMMESIRSRIMSRMHKRYEKGWVWKNSVGINTLTKLNKVTETCRKCTMLFASGGEYEVRDNDITYIVNLNARTCDCKVWDLTGIPCHHATIVILNRRDDLEKYCHVSLFKETYLRAYNHIIHPVGNVKFWPDFDVQPAKVNPPALRRRLGRPKKARRRQLGEAPAVRKRSSTITCALCKQIRHNKRTCEGGPKRNRKGIWKRRKINDQENSKTTQESSGNQMTIQESVANQVTTTTTTAASSSQQNSNNNVSIEGVFRSTRASSLLGKEFIENIMQKETARERAKTKKSVPASATSIPDEKGASQPANNNKEQSQSAKSVKATKGSSQPTKKLV